MKPSRRRFLESSLGAPILAAGSVAAKDSPEPNPVLKENREAGSNDWQLTRVRLDERGGYRAPDVEGYCSHQSVQAGDKLDLFVSTKQETEVKIEIFRTGYYAGRGARLMTTLGPFPGEPQPVPELKRGDRHLVECEWKPITSLVIPDDWVSGVYLGRLTVDDAGGHGYWQNYVVFVVRDDRPADLCLQVSDNTWQAYNRWPTKYSVYTHPKGNQGPWADVSFDRPYGKYAQIYENPLSIGSGEWLCFEFPMAYWLEEQGYDVTYCSNSDMVDPAYARPGRFKGFLSNGHDEYWDLREYRNVEKLRDTGTSLLFFSGNSVCWVSPMTPSFDGRENRILFRGGPYGGDYRYAEARERDEGPFPHRGPDEGYLMGARNVDPVNGGGDWICEKPEHWMFEGTGMKKGDSIPGLIGWEYHGDPPDDIEGLEVVGAGTALQGGVNPQEWAATIYPGPEGNFVFNASTIFWCQGLSSPPGHMLPWSHWSRPHGPDERVQRMTANLLDRALAQG
ncbi:MAG: hypothetical protein P1U81_17115 [Verrucomicrobiales bacterium]|nr:hypothetical protein [Verrucomicrobiales bacterium]